MSNDMLISLYKCVCYMLHYSIFSAYSVYLYLWHVADIGILLFGHILKKCWLYYVYDWRLSTEDYGPVLQFQKPNYVTTVSMSQLCQLCHKSLILERSEKSG